MSEEVETPNDKVDPDPHLNVFMWIWHGYRKPEVTEICSTLTESTLDNNVFMRGFAVCT